MGTGYRGRGLPRAPPRLWLRMSRIGFGTLKTRLVCRHSDIGIVFGCCRACRLCWRLWYPPNRLDRIASIGQCPDDLYRCIDDEETKVDHYRYRGCVAWRCRIRGRSRIQLNASGPGCARRLRSSHHPTRLSPLFSAKISAKQVVGQRG